jgi:hypothetical protein
MRRLFTAVAVALVGLFLSASAASAQPGGKLLPKRGRAVPKLSVIGVSQQGGFARVVVSNRSTLGTSGRSMQMRIFRGGRQIGVLKGFVGAIPAGRSRVVLMRTNVRLGLPGTVLAFQGSGMNAVFLRGGNARFVLSNRSVASVIASKGALGRPGKKDVIDEGDAELDGGAESAARKAEVAAKKAEAAKKGAERAKKEAEAVVETEEGEGEGEGN